MRSNLILALAGAFLFGFSILALAADRKPAIPGFNVVVPWSLPEPWKVKYYGLYPEISAERQRLSHRIFGFKPMYAASIDLMNFSLMQGGAVSPILAAHIIFDYEVFRHDPPATGRELNYLARVWQDVHADADRHPLIAGWRRDELFLLGFALRSERYIEYKPHYATTHPFLWRLSNPEYIRQNDVIPGVIRMDMPVIKEFWRRNLLLLALYAEPTVLPVLQGMKLQELAQDPYAREWVLHPLGPQFIKQVLDDYPAFKAAISGGVLRKRACVGWMSANRASLSSRIREALDVRVPPGPLPPVGD